MQGIVIALEKLLYLKTNSNISYLQLRSITSTDDLPALTFAEKLVERSIVLNKPLEIDLSILVSESILIRGAKPDAVEILTEIAKHQGYKNPEDLYPFVNSTAKEENIVKLGWKRELDVGNSRYLSNSNSEFNFSKDIPSNTGPPYVKEVDYVNPFEVTEVKSWGNLNGNPLDIDDLDVNNVDVFKALMNKAGKQVGKIDFTHPDNATIIIKRSEGFIHTPDNITNNMNHQQLEVLLKETYTEIGQDLDNLTELVIHNNHANSPHVFTPVNWQN